MTDRLRYLSLSLQVRRVRATFASMRKATASGLFPVRIAAESFKKKAQRSRQLIQGVRRKLHVAMFRALELEETMDIMKVLSCLSVMALASTTAFAADNQTLNSPSNPNCSPGTLGCTANYPTTDHSDQNPIKASTANSPMNPNCSPGQAGCSANYPTTDHSDDNPLKK
jgi:hypothetical protein